MEPPSFLAVGDVVEVEVTGLGILQNTVFADENGTIDNEVARNATFYGFHIDLTPPNNPNVASAIAGSQQSGVGCRP